MTKTKQKTQEFTLFEIKTDKFMPPERGQALYFARWGTEQQAATICMDQACMSKAQETWQHTTIGNRTVLTLTDNQAMHIFKRLTCADDHGQWAEKKMGTHFYWGNPRDINAIVDALKTVV